MLIVYERRTLAELDCCNTCEHRHIAIVPGGHAGCLVDGQIQVDAENRCVRYRMEGEDDGSSVAE